MESEQSKGNERACVCRSSYRPLPVVSAQRTVQVNKPFLPLAAQRMSKRMAWVLVMAACAMGLAITKTFFR